MRCFSCCWALPLAASGSKICRFFAQIFSLIRLAFHFGHILLVNPASARAMSTSESVLPRQSSRSRIPPLFYEPQSKRVARSQTRASDPKVDECTAPEVKLLDLDSDAMDVSTEAAESVCGDQADAALAATSADEEVAEGATTSASEDDSGHVEASTVATDAELVAAPAAIDGVQPAEAKSETPAKLKGRAPKAKAAGVKAKPDTVVVEPEIEGAAAAASTGTHLESIPEEIVLIADTSVDPSSNGAPEVAKGKAKKAKAASAKGAPVSAELGVTAATGAAPPTSDTAAVGKLIPLVFPKKKSTVAAK
jgi:hypothetical protein